MPSDKFYKPDKMDFKVEGPWNIESIAGQKETFLNSRHPKMAKIVTFWLWWQPFNSFCFETLSIFPLRSFFLFATQKRGEGGFDISTAYPLVSPALFYLPYIPICMLRNLKYNIYIYIYIYMYIYKSINSLSS